MRRERRESLEWMARDGQAAGLHEATAGQCPGQGDRLPMATFPAFPGTRALYSAYPKGRIKPSGTDRLDQPAQVR
jgi:hypothetical protein